jgi:hypothetical protein
VVSSTHGAIPFRVDLGLQGTLILIAVAALIVAALAVGAVALTGPLTFHLALAVVLGVFFSFILGGGLFAVSFFSARSGFDDDASTSAQDKEPRE